VIRTLPLALRNRLTETILAALHDPAARRDLERLTGPAAAAEWLGAGEGRWADFLVERARRACEALAARPPRGPVADLRTALADAGALFDAGLHFEVHELLEPHWSASQGDTREALQGLIQAAVGFQHLANGNRAGARALLAEAGARLHGRTLLGRGLDGFARALGEAAERVGAGGLVVPPPWPA
jgi:hypothetical protein